MVVLHIFCINTAKAKGFRLFLAEKNKKTRLNAVPVGTTLKRGFSYEILNNRLAFSRVRRMASSVVIPFTSATAAAV